MTRIAVFGLGQVGARVAQMCVERPDLELRGAVVYSPDKDGVDIGELIGRGPIGIAASADPDAVARDPAIDAVIYCGLGQPADVADMLGRLAEHGKDCVTVTGLIHPETALGRAGAEALRARARAGGARIVGAGWNPGFLLDCLPVAWGNSIPGLRHISAERVCDLAAWGSGVLDHLGIGSTRPVPPGSWTAHLPVAECVQLVSDALGLGVDQVDLNFEPRIATETRFAAGRIVKAGTAVGFQAVGCGLVSGIEVVRLGWNCTFAMDHQADGLLESARLVLTGETSVEIVATGSTLTDGYPATAARALNTVRPLRDLPPGLYRPDQVPASSRGAPDSTPAR
jgi:hypothetical protein